MMGTWSRIYDVGDLEDVVRGSSIVSSTSTADVSSPHKDLVKRSECCMEKGVTQLSKNHALPLKLDEERPTILSPTQGHMNDSSLSPNKGVHSKSATVKIEPNVNSLPRLPGIRRRKSQQKRIMCVPAAGGSWNKHGGGGVSSDLWAWRKYGQKPIKGSPYPRGYYRCSSSKGCPARKQIERSHTDPTLLVITYTAEHNHAWPASRNALARSSRQNVFQNSNNNNNTHEVSVPNTAQLHHSPSHKSALAPQIESHSHSQEKMEISCVQNQEDDNDCVGIDQDLGFRADHDLFAGLAELPELYPNDFRIHSDEEAASSVIDPFNLFDWPPLVSTTVTPNS